MSRGFCTKIVIDGHWPRAAPQGYFLNGQKGTYVQQPFLLSCQKKRFLDFQRKDAGTMLVLPASISGAEVIRIVSASVPAQPLTLALVELLCVSSAAPAWVLSIRRWRAEGGAPYGGATESPTP